MKQLLKKSISAFIVLVALLSGSEVFAQPPGGGGQGPQLPDSDQIKEMVADISEQLALNEDQETQILETYEAHFEAVKELVSKGRPERTEMDALKTQFEKSVNAVLTEEQKELYAAYLEENQPPMDGERPAR